MDLLKLLPIQRKLIEHIEKKHNLQGQNLLKKNTVALLTELFECVNEARFFKFWSHDQKPRKKKISIGFAHSKGPFEYIANPLLEEYVDTVHFTLNLANDIDYVEHTYNDPGDIDLNDLVLGLAHLMAVFPYTKKNDKRRYLSLIFDYLIKLGYQLGFSEEQVIEAYMKKNEENHARQEEGY